MSPTLPLVLLLLCSAARSGTQPEILWTSLDRTTPLFLPASVLQDPAAEKLQELGVSRGAVDSVREAISQAWNAKSTKELGCAGPPEGDVPGKAPGAPAGPSSQPLPSILKAVRDTEVAFTAQVSELVPGWIPPLGYAGTLVRVRVIEVLADTEGTIYEGQFVAYLQVAGELKLGNRVLCTKNPAQVPARVGDRLLVTGFRDLANPSYISSSATIIFHISGDFVLPPPGEQLEAGDGLPLQQIRRFAQQREKVKP